MRILAAVLTLVLVLAGSQAKAADEPYVIYGILPTTGGGAFLGTAEIKAVALIEKLTNASGGISGRPIHFQISDDATNPQQTVQIVNGFLAKHVPVMIGPALAATCRAIEPMLKDALTSYCFSPGVHPEAGSSMFSTGLKMTDQMQAAMRYWASQGWTKVGFIGSTDATGQDGEDSIHQLLALPENSKLKLVDDERFGTTDISVAAQITHLKASGAQVIWCMTTGPQMGTVLRNATNAGLKAPIFSSNGNMTQAQMKQYDTFFPAGIYFTGESYYARSVLKPGPVKTAVEAFYKAANEAGLPIEESQANAWDGTMLVVDALRHLGTNATAVQVREYIAGIQNYAGINGMYDFKRYPQRGIGDRDGYVMHWDSAKHDLVILSGPGGVRR